MKNVNFEFINKYDGITSYLLLHDNRNIYNSLEKIRDKISDYLFPKTEFYEISHGREIFEFLLEDAEDIVSTERYGPYRDIVVWLEKFEDLAMYTINICESKIESTNIIGYEGRELIADLFDVNSFVGTFYERINKGEHINKVNKDFINKLYKTSRIKDLPESHYLHEKLLYTVQGLVDDKYDYAEWFVWYRHLERVVVETLRIFKG